MPQIVSSSDVSVAKAWINAAEKFYHPTALVAYDTTSSPVGRSTSITSSPWFPQVPFIIPCSRRILSLSSQPLSRQDSKASWPRSRCFLWSQPTRLRSPLNDVIELGPVCHTLSHLVQPNMVVSAVWTWSCKKSRPRFASCLVSLNSFFPCCSPISKRQPEMV